MKLNRHGPSFSRPLAGIALLSLLSALPAMGGVVSNYDVVIFGDLEMGSAAHVHGSTLIGGNLKGSGIGEFGHGGPFAAETLTLAGKVTQGTHRVLKGNATIGGLDGGSLTNNDGTITVLPGQNFSSLFADFVTFSTNYGNESATGTTLFEHGILSLKGTGASLEIFQVSTTQLPSLNNLQFSSLAPDAIIVINVSGSSLNFGASHLGDIVNNTSVRSRVLWNFTEATSININGRRWDGSILAPYAALTNMQEIYGDVYVASAHFKNEVHPNFTGNLPIPEPSTFLFAGTVGALAMVFLRRRRVA
jgi:choice-of-anchor A domain-containing protein